MIRECPYSKEATLDNSSFKRTYIILVEYFNKSDYVTYRTFQSRADIADLYIIFFFRQKRRDMTIKDRKTDIQTER